MSQPTLETTPRDVKNRLEAGEHLALIDVREPGEYALTRIDGSILIPMGSIASQLTRIEGLADDATIVTICHHGVRSLSVAAWLQNEGIANCVSMSGGIDRWSIEVDPSIPRY